MEVDLVSKLIGEPVVTKTSYSRITDYYTFLMMKDVLYKMYTNEIQDDDVSVFNCLGMKSVSEPTLVKSVPDFRHEGIYSFKTQYTYFFVKYENSTFIVNFIVNLNAYDPDLLYHIIAVEHIDGESYAALQLYSHIRTKGFKYCGFKNKIVILKGQRFTEDLFNYSEIQKPAPVNLSNIFLRETALFHLNRMIYEIKNYNEGKKPVRYLFNGSPGTGKTQAISAIMNQVCGKITIVILKGLSFNFNDVFDFCTKLCPCLLVIDDLDFIALDRKKSTSVENLNDLLNALDGIYGLPIFLLAATNDKALVDAAASRPGRFDLIIDFGALEPGNYKSLILRETDDPELIDLFNDAVLECLAKRKITGAFIVNLIKQLKSVKGINKAITYKDMADLISFSYDGFFDMNDERMKKVVGF